MSELSELMTSRMSQIIQLTDTQKCVLEQLGNTCSDWKTVKFLCNVDDVDKSLQRIRNCTFCGDIYIGVLDDVIEIENGINLLCGLYNSNFYNYCMLEDNCYVKNTSILSNAYIGNKVSVLNCTQIIGPQEKSQSSLYGDNTEVTIGPESNNEGTSRCVHINKSITYSDVCHTLFNKKSTETHCDKTMHKDYSSPQLTYIGKKSILRGCDRIENSFIGCGSAVITSFVKNTTICDCNTSNDNQSQVLIANSTVTDCIIHHHCKVEGNVTLESVLMFAYSTVSHNAHVAHTIIASDSGISHAECCHSVVGPFIGFHHTSLLIATCWLLGRGNIGYGAMIGANHTGRSNDQESLLGEGCFLGLGSSVKFPFNAYHSPYTIIAAGTACLPQKISFPFSLVNTPDSSYIAVGSDSAVSPALNNIKPGWILWGNPYFVERSMSKFTKRRQSTEYRTDFRIFRPAIVDMVKSARSALMSLKSKYMTEFTQNLSNVFTEQHVSEVGKCTLQLSDVDKAIDAYTDFVRRYALHGLLFLLCSRGRKAAYDLITECANMTTPVSTVTATSAVNTMLQDVCDMETVQYQQSIEDHLGGVQHAAAPEESASLTHLLTLRDSNKRCCLLTDSHIPTVLVHQITTLYEEYPQINAETELTSLLNDLVKLEKDYAYKVNEGKNKDIGRASVIIPDYSERIINHVSKSALMTTTDNNNKHNVLLLDATIQSSKLRANHIELCVKNLIASFIEFDRHSRRVLKAIVENLSHINCNFRTILKSRNDLSCLSLQSNQLFASYLIHCFDVLQQDVFPQISDIFAPVECLIEPECIISSDGIVCLAIKDYSHLNQIDQYLISKCFGEMSVFVESNCSPHFFARHITIGTISASTLEKEEFKLAADIILSRISDQLPHMYLDSVKIMNSNGDGGTTTNKFCLLG